MGTSKEAAKSTPGMQQPVFSLLTRLEDLSQKPDFQLQRELALSHFLQPYLETGKAISLNPLPAEVGLANLYMYCDYMPSDGHFSLIEQVRDDVLDHIPEEERVWLDPMRHSFMDILEISAIGESEAPHVLRLRSLGDGSEYCITSETLALSHKPGQVLITRLFRRGESTVYPEMAISLSHDRGHLVFTSLRDLQREMEAFSGAFELSEWQEYVKRYGHIMIWTLANLRLKWLVELEDQIRFVDTHGRPFLHYIAIYEHSALNTFQQTLREDPDWMSVDLPGAYSASSDPNAGSNLQALRVWEKRVDEPTRNRDGVIGRLSLTNRQLIAEADSLEHFNDLKHWLAGTFGFSLHFKGETIVPPAHHMPSFELLSDGYPQVTETVSPEEEHRILSSLLESSYLDWAEHPSPALQDKTPRHIALTSTGAKEVTGLIQDLENNDLAKLRTGKTGFDYDSLRSHVGIL